MTRRKTRPKLLDLFCGAGGAAMGYHRAGFDVIGVDLHPQPRYPFAFVQADGTTYPFDWCDVVHASPPCQKYSVQTKQHGTSGNHPDIVALIRGRLVESGLPWVIENVPGAPLLNPIVLCGSQFGWTRLRRHRLFESNIRLLARPCDHSIQHDVISVTGNSGGSSNRDGAARFGSTAVWRDLMGIDWMTGRELAEAIPPAYTEFIGRQLLAQVTR